MNEQRVRNQIYLKNFFKILCRQNGLKANQTLRLHLHIEYTYLEL